MKYMIDRGFTEETLKRFRIGYYTGYYTGERVIFPIMDENRRVVAEARRAIDEQQPKYMFFPHDRSAHNTELFGLHIAIESGRKVVHLVEGFTDVMMMYQNGIENVAACMGMLQDAQIEKLRSHFEEVIVMFDNDLAGKASAKKAVERLIEVGVKASLVSITGEDKDPDAYIRNQGIDAFKELIGQS